MPFDAATLFGAVGLFGIGGPLISIGAPKAIAQWFQGAERGLAMGVYITGPALGNMLALALTNSVLMPLTGGNWRQVLLIYSGFILITGLAWFLLGSHPINRVVGARRTPSRDGRRPDGGLRKAAAPAEHPGHPGDKHRRLSFFIML